jgi:hypothetical protein
MIDKVHGGIYLPQYEFVIDCNLTDGDFVSSRLFHDSISKKINEYMHYRFITTVDNCEFQFRIIFDPIGKINFMTISVATGEKSQWKNWSSEREIERKRKNDDWLREQLGNPPYVYSWGEISSSYDPRAGSSHITFHYRTNANCR